MKTAKPLCNSTGARKCQNGVAVSSVHSSRGRRVGLGTRHQDRQKAAAHKASYSMQIWCFDLQFIIDPPPYSGQKVNPASYPCFSDPQLLANITKGFDCMETIGQCRESGFLEKSEQVSTRKVQAIPLLRLRKQP